MKTFGYLLMAVMACMTCSCRDEEPLPDPVPPVMEPENPGNPEEPDTGKVYLGIAPISSRTCRNRGPWWRTGRRGIAWE